MVAEWRLRKSEIWVRNSTACIPKKFEERRDWYAMIGANERGWYARVGAHTPRPKGGVASPPPHGGSPCGQPHSWLANRPYRAASGAPLRGPSGAFSAETYQRGYPPPSRVGLTLSRHRHGSKLAAPEARWMTSSPRQRRGGCKAGALCNGMCDWYAVRKCFIWQYAR